MSAAFTNPKGPTTQMVTPAELGEYVANQRAQTREEWFIASRSLEPSGKERGEENRIIADVWENCDNQEYRESFSHWQGSQGFQGEHWNAVGEKTHAVLSRYLPLFSTTFQARWHTNQLAMLEWGPGGGSNLFKFAAQSRLQYAVDLSAKNLGECAARLGDQAARFRPLVLSGPPESVQTEVGEPLDLFVSTAVFQHFPSKHYGLEVLACVQALLASGGVGYIQIRYDNGNPIYLPKTIDSYGRSLGHAFATSYPLDLFAYILDKLGFEVLSARIEDPNINYAGFVFQKR